METLQKKSKKTCDWILVFIVTVLLLLGFLMVYSSSYPDGYYNYDDAFFFLRKQVIAGVLGLITMVIVSFFPYKYYRRFSKMILMVCIIFGVVVFAFGFTAYGAKRWLNLGGMSIQPSEIIKIGAVLYMADYLEKNRDKLRTFKDGFLKTMLVIGGLTLLIVIQQDLSTSIVLAAVLTVMFFCAGANLLHLVLTVIAGVAGIIVLIAAFPYRMQRIVAFVDPFKYYSGIGWQICQSLFALGTGELFGLGLGKSRQKFFYLPEAYNDFIFSIIGEELGFIGCLFVIILFVLFAWRGIRIAMNCKDLYGSLVATGLTGLVLMQFLIHIAVATSSMPPTGRALPFISAGGTSILFLLASIGVLLNISKSADIYRS